MNERKAEREEERKKEKRKKEGNIESKKDMAIFWDMK
jgi:hypothetical protein